MTAPKRRAAKKASVAKRPGAGKKASAARQPGAAKRASVAKPPRAPKPAKRPPSPTRKPPRGAGAVRSANVTALRVNEIESLRAQVERKSAELLPRWSANPEDVQKSVAQLVLSLVEFLRKLLERQAIRRMEADTLDAEDVERVGLALMRLEETVHDLAARFGLAPEELNLDLGPLGRLS